jgi:hypothetical protein
MARWIACAVAVEPVKATPSTRGSEVSAAPTVAPSPGRSCSAARGHAGLVQQRRPRAAISGVCLGRFGQHRVARGQRGGDLAGEDGEREVPRADAAKTPRGGLLRQAPARGGVVAQEIDRLAHSATASAGRLARLPREQGEDLGRLLVEVGGAAQRAARSACGGRPTALRRGDGAARHRRARSGAPCRRCRPRSAGLRTVPPPPPCARQGAARGSGRGEGVARAPRGRQRPRSCRSKPLGVRALGRNRSGRAATRGMRLHRAASALERIGGDRSGGTSSSTIWLTKDCWRRFPEAAARDRPAGRDAPHRRIDAAARAVVAARSRAAPRPCRAGAGTRTRRAVRPAISRIAATVWALWVANCG